MIQNLSGKVTMASAKVAPSACSGTVLSNVHKMHMSSMSHMHPCIRTSVTVTFGWLPYTLPMKKGLWCIEHSVA